jgi:hypothetical protein
MDELCEYCGSSYQVRWSEKLMAFICASCRMEYKG